MGFIDRGMTGGYQQKSLGSLTVTGANETIKVVSPAAISGALLQSKFISERYSLAEIWVPVGLIYTVTTTMTVTNTIVVLRKNGVSAATGGLITIPFVAADATTEKPMIGFTPWTFAAADAAGDAWSVLVTQTSTAGVVSLVLVYGVRVVAGVSDGVTI